MIVKLYYELKIDEENIYNLVLFDIFKKKLWQYGAYIYCWRQSISTNIQGWCKACLLLFQHQIGLLPDVIPYRLEREHIWSCVQADMHLIGFEGGLH